MKQCLVISDVTNNESLKGYTPFQIKSAYNLGISGKGEGITVAVIDFIGNKYIESNLKVFSERFDLPNANINFVQNGKGQNFDFAAYIEPCVDTQWVHAISPMAEILVVKASELSINGAIESIKTALGLKPDIILLTFQVPMSDALLEYTTEFEGDTVFVASAGDYGAQVNFPSCIPNCISVGGTTLEISPGGKRISSETVWNGTGGGICDFFNIPSYQKNMSGIMEITSGKRGVPDVSAFASQSPGVSVYHSSFNGSYGWYSIGGTSVSASITAGIIACLLSSDIGKGLTKKDFPSLLYKLAGWKEYTNKYDRFIDITEGTNGKYSALRGYDLCTGLGSLINL